MGPLARSGVKSALPDEIHAEMTRYRLNRHNGNINGLFADYSVRKIGLKELWKLKWHRDFDTNGP